MNRKHFLIQTALVLALISSLLASCVSPQEPPIEVAQVPEEVQVEPSKEPTQDPTPETTEAPPPTPSPIPPPDDPNFPPGMVYHYAIYEPNQNQIMIFGGNSKHGFDADVKLVFSYDPITGQWGEPREFLASPAWKSALAPVYDAESSRVIVFNVDGETWAYDFSADSWQSMAPATSPPGRCGHSTIYDSESDIVIMYGGFGCKSPMDLPFDDVWAYDFNSNTWTQMAPGPGLRVYQGMVYDSESDRILMWGGRPETEISDNSIWVYDFNTDTWTENPVEDGPVNRSTYHTMTYIPELDRTYIIGGVVLTGPFSGDFVSEIWEYDLNSNTWNLIEAEGSPGALAKQAAAYDPQTGLIYFYGGSKDILYDNDFISYEFWSFDPVNHIWDNLLIE